MKKQVYRKLLAACVSVSLGTVLLAGCGDSAGTTGTKTEDVSLTTEAQNEARTADVSEAQQESETQTEVQENNTSEDVVEPVGEVTTFTLPDGPEESDIFVQPVADISDDFIRGMDASAVLSVETVGLCIMATMEKSRMCLRHLRSPESIISACVYGMIRMTRTAMAMAAETMI